MSATENHGLELEVPGGLYANLTELASRDSVTVEALAVGLLTQVVAHGSPAELAAELALLRAEVKALEFTVLRLTGAAGQG